MLEDLRKKQKVIIYFVTIVFVVGMAAIGVSDLFTKKNYVGKVNGQKITYSAFNKKLQESIQSYQDSNPGAELDARTMKMLSDQTWEQLIQQMLLDKQVKKNHIRVTDKDIIDKLKNNPPDEIKTNPNFLTNGQFDYQKYISVLTSNPPFANALEQYVRASLPYEKLINKIKSKAKINPDTVRQEFEQNNNKADGKGIWFDYRKAGGVNVTDAEIKAYYEKNKDKEFKKGPASKVKFIRIVLKPSDTDYSQSKLDIDDIYNRVRKGEDFATLAKEYSDDPGSAQNNGDLGWVSKGMMVPEFEKVAFSTPINQVSAPFKTQFGWHIVKGLETKIDPKQGPQVHVAHILIKVDASQNTKDDLALLAEKIRKEAKKNGLAAAAKANKLEVQESDAVYEDSQAVPMVGDDPTLLKFAQTKKVNAISPAIPDAYGNFVIAQVSWKVGDHYEDFEQVKMRIKYDLLKKRQSDLMFNKAKEFAGKYTPAQYLAMAAKEGYQVIELTGINAVQGIPNVGMVPELNKAMLAAKTGQFTPVVKTAEGAFLTLVTNRIYPDMKQFAAQKEYLTSQIKNREENAYFQKWYQDLRKKAKIVDNRNAFNF